MGKGGVEEGEGRRWDVGGERESGGGEGRGGGSRELVGGPGNRWGGLFECLSVADSRVCVCWCVFVCVCICVCVCLYVCVRVCAGQTDDVKECLRPPSEAGHHGDQTKTPTLPPPSSSPSSSRTP